MAETPVVLVTSHLLKAMDVSIVSEVKKPQNSRKVFTKPWFSTEYLYQ